MERAIDISVVIPAFNEAKRLPLFLERVISYCRRQRDNYEIIVVNDGSSDGTLESVVGYRAVFAALCVIRVKRNRGKGYAVKRGLLHSRGRICLFLDADGSVEPEEIGKNLRFIRDEGYDIFIGSRVIRGDEQALKVKWYRKTIGVIFNFCVQVFLFKNIRDTQCGFKMFRKEAVKPLFSRSYLRNFSFDVEILYLAYKMGYKVKEGPVSWRHVAGSKVNLFLDPIRMFFDILRIRNWHCTPINPYAKYMGPDEYRYMYDMEMCHWWFVSRRNLIMSLIPDGKTTVKRVILDVGSGTGGDLDAFSAIGQAYGIDASSKAVQFCFKRGLQNVRQASAEHIPYPERSFDLITCIDVLEHVVNPVEVLGEMKRVLKEDGKLIISVPAFRLLWSQHDEALCHLRRYERESLACDIYEAGLRVERTGYYFFASFFIVAPVRILRRLYIARRTRSDTTTLPPQFLNKFLIILFKIELAISERFTLPLGTTLYAVVSNTALTFH